MSTRQLYENKASLINEAAVAKIVESAWSFHAVKLPIAYRIDYALERNDSIEAWMEIKCRNIHSATFNTFMMSLGKWLAGRNLAVETNTEFFVVVSYTDGIKYIDSARVPYPTVGFGGRTDRGDWQDKEPCVFIPTELFVSI